MTKRILVLILACMSVLTLAAASKEEYHTDKDIPYRNEKDDYIASQCRLDVYYPKELKESGLIVVAVGYRFMDKVHISDCIDDAAPMLIVSGDRELEMNGRYEE